MALLQNDPLKNTVILQLLIHHHKYVFLVKKNLKKY